MTSRTALAVAMAPKISTRKVSRMDSRWIEREPAARSLK